MQFPDTLSIVREKQPYYLGCVFAIVREWYRLGKPRRGETRHDFREWCQALDFIVQTICGLAPLMDGHIEARERVSNPKLTFVRNIAIQAERAGRLDQPLTASQIYEIADEAELAIPGVKPNDPQGEERGRKAIGVKLATVFKEGDTIMVEGFTVKRDILEKARPDGNGSMQSKSYTFSRLPHLHTHHTNPHNPVENCTVFQASTKLGVGRCGAVDGAPPAAEAQPDAVLDVPDDVGWTLRKRLAKADELLRGRPTNSQIESHRIGLARHAGSHPGIDAILTRLKEG